MAGVQGGDAGCVKGATFLGEKVSQETKPASNTSTGKSVTYRRQIRGIAVSECCTQIQIHDTPPRLIKKKIQSSADSSLPREPFDTMMSPN